MDQFAKNLAQHLLNPESDVGVSAKPISGLSVLVKGITKSITG
jgi:hypothetical protein